MTACKLNETYLSFAKATAPGHLLERMIARPYWGSSSDETLGVQAGIPFTAATNEEKKINPNKSTQVTFFYFQKQTEITDFFASYFELPKLENGKNICYSDRTHVHLQRWRLIIAGLTLVSVPPHLLFLLPLLLPQNHLLVFLQGCAKRNDPNHIKQTGYNIECGDKNYKYSEMLKKSNNFTTSDDKLSKPTERSDVFVTLQEELLLNIPLIKWNAVRRPYQIVNFWSNLDSNLRKPWNYEYRIIRIFSIQYNSLVSMVESGCPPPHPATFSTRRSLRCAPLFKHLGQTTMPEAHVWQKCT